MKNKTIQPDTSNKQRSLFIVFEGIDGSGKSTQADLLYTYVLEKGLPVIKNVEPTNGTWGKKIRSILQGDKIPDAKEQLKLFIKDRQDDVRHTIQPALDNNKIIIMDRYFYSNVAYQGAAGLDPAFIISENERNHFPKPDRVYLVDLPPKCALKRIQTRNNNRRDIFEKESYLQKVRSIYFNIKEDCFLILDGDKTIEKIFETIKSDFDKLYSGYGHENKA